MSAASATVYRTISGVLRSSPTRGILDIRGGATRPLEAILVAVCYANRGFSMSALPLPVACPA